MEVLNNYSFRQYNFTLWFFRILLVMMATVIILVFVLQINETVTIRDGEIVAGNPQADYKAPFEGQIININVKEGQPVNIGDTMLVMRNVDYREQQAKITTEIEYLQKKIASIEVLQGALQKKKAALDQTTAIAAKKFQLEINRLVNDMRTMDQQYKFQGERMTAAREKYVGDSILFKKDMLSKYEFNTTKDANLALRENLTTIQSQRNKHSAEKNIAYNDFTKEQNTLLLTRVQLDENEQTLVQAKNDHENQLKQAQETLHKLNGELNKQFVVSTTRGIVNFLFNTKQSSNLLSKGELLVSVAPKTISYYAKVFLPEKDILYVKPGLDAKLKLDAYQRFKYGPITGKVSYVAERKENEKFFALVALDTTNQLQLKSGYTINGEIIVQRLPLIKYFIKKLFKQFDQA